MGGITGLPLVEDSLVKGEAIPNLVFIHLTMLHGRHSAAASCGDSVPVLWCELPGAP